MSDLTARRWTKDDKDRIYVNAAIDGARVTVGYVDVKTGYTRSNDVAVHSPQDIYAVAATWAVANMVGIPAPKYDTRGPITQGNTDLAENKAGASLNRKSGPAPLRSRLFGRAKKDSWSIGAKGEGEVGKLLDRAKDVKALHSVVVNEYGADIDHIVFSPYGIYTVNTKTHYGAKITVNSKGFFVNGTAVSHVSKAKVEAERVARILTAVAGQQIPVTPMVVIVGAKEVAVSANTGVMVVASDDALSSMRLRTTVLTADQISWLYDRARESDTWSRKA